MKSNEIEFQGFSGIGSCLRKSIRSMAHKLGARTSGARFAVILDVGLKSRPVVLHTYGVKGLRLAKVSCEGMVVRVLKNTES